MLKLIFIITALIIMVGCNNVHSQGRTETTNKIDNAEVSAALKVAIEIQDFRLFVRATRGIEIPGLIVNEFQEAAKLCGTKYMPNTTDNIKDEQDKALQKKLYSDMAQYNKKMWQVCKKQQK